MNKQKIHEAIDLLKTAVKDEDEFVTLNVLLSKEDMDVLHAICKTNISVPRVVHENIPRIDRRAVGRMLNVLRDALDRLP